MRPILFEAALAAYPETVRNEVADVTRQTVEATLNRVEQEANQRIAEEQAMGMAGIPPGWAPTHAPSSIGSALPKNPE